MQEAIIQGPESRSEWLLDKFAFGARKTGRAEFYKIWRDDNHAIDLGNLDAMEKIDYIHLNAVRAGLVEMPAHYLYSSAVDYAVLVILFSLIKFPHDRKIKLTIKLAIKYVS